MTQKQFKDKYPIYELVVNKSETECQTVDDVVAYFKEKIEAHPVAVYLGVFDHYAHTTALAEGTLNDQIQAAKNILFCFGKELPTPEVLAVRPRSIGVCDMGDRFVIVFMEAPNPQANDTMIAWTEAIKKS
jgi:hypothetical protein